MYRLNAVVLVWISCVAWLAHPSICNAQPKFSAIHGASAAKWDEWIASLDKQKLRPNSLSVAELSGEPTYAAIAVENNTGQTWAARRDLTADAYQQEFLAQTKKRLRPISVACYRKGDVLHYAAIFVKDDMPLPQWAARHGMDSKSNQQQFDTLTRQGFRPVQGVVCESAKDLQFSYLFVKDNLQDWLSQSGLTAEQYEKLVKQYLDKGGYPVSAWAYATKNGTRFGAIVAKDPEKNGWYARHQLTPKQYQEYFDDMTGKGHRPTQVCAYPWDGEIRYLAVFTREPKLK